MNGKYLHDIDSSEKALYTAFLLLMLFGYLMALIYLYTSHQGHDNKPGVSIEDIADNYYGNRSGTRLEAAIRGTMAGNIQSSDDKNKIVLWLKDGAEQGGYDREIKSILDKSCVACHQPSSGLPVPDLSTYAGVQKVAEVDMGQSIHALMKLSHIHLFGIGLVSFALGLIFRFAKLGSTIKTTIVITPFLAIAIDIVSWFLTKWDPIYAFTIIFAGALIGFSWICQIVIPIYQMWFHKNKPLN